MILLRLILTAIIIVCLSCAGGPKSSEKPAATTQTQSQEQQEDNQWQSEQNDVAQTKPQQESVQSEFEQFSQEEPKAPQDNVATEDEVNAAKNAQVAPTQEQSLKPSEESLPAAIEPVSQELNEVSNINYLANENGGTVVIKTKQPVIYETRENSERNQFIIELANTKLPKHLTRPFNMRDFSGEIASVDAYQTPQSTTSRIVIQLRHAVMPEIQQEGNSLLVMAPQGLQQDTGSNVAANESLGNSNEAAVVPMSAPESTPPVDQEGKALSGKTLDEFMLGEGKFYGKKISIEFKNAEVREVIGLLAEESGTNIIIGEDVKGTISLRLRDVPWDQALVVVMKAKQLGYLRQGNVLRIDELTKIRQEAQMAQELLDTRKIVEPLMVKMIALSYASVEDVQTQIKPFLTTRGQSVGDKRTSSIIITDIKDVVDKVENIVKSLDIPPAQVLIEGKIVEANENFSQSIGLSWNYAGVPIDAGQNSKGQNTTITSGISMDPLGKDASGTMGISFGVLKTDLFNSVSTFLALSEKKDDVKIISSPRIVAMHNQDAEISQITQIPLISETMVQGSENNVLRTVTFKDVKLSLKVKPQVSADNRIAMQLELLREFAGAVADPSTQAVPIHGRTAKTTIMVKDGQTAVIGGIYLADYSKGKTGVPWLSNIPVLGWLFKGEVVKEQKNELLIFLTPRILGSDDASNSEVE